MIFDFLILEEKLDKEAAASTKKSMEDVMKGPGVDMEDMTDPDSDMEDPEDIK